MFTILFTLELVSNARTHTATLSLGCVCMSLQGKRKKQGLVERRSGAATRPTVYLFLIQVKKTHFKL